MKRLLGTDISGSYKFDPAARTVTFAGLSANIGLGNILLITNVTRNIIIYNFADAARGEQAFSGNVLTLTFDTTSHAASDVLQIYLDVDSPTFDTKTTTTDDQIILLRRIVKLMESQGAVDLAQRQRINIDAIGAAVTPASTTIPVSQATASSLNATVSIAASQTLTNLTTLAGYDQRLYSDWARQAYSTGIRTQLTFT